MIHTLRRVARAIHRRALWQVLAAYVAGGYVLLMLVDWMTAVAGLPSWTGTMTMVLLVAMLPLIVATTVAQGGLPGLRMEDVVDPNDLPGLTPEQVLRVPDAHPLYGSRIFTWRNMTLGGVAGAALLVTSVVAYMTMWALGIGPVGSLLAQGVIERGGRVALADFQNVTDDPSLTELVRDVFQLELSRSSVFTLSDTAQGTARLVVWTVVSREGEGYSLASSITTPSGSTLARVRERASGEEDVLVAVVALTERVRERIGESLRSIRDGERLAPAGTESPEALRLFLRAGRAASEGDPTAAVDLLVESVRVDSTFVMAWLRLGVLAEQSADQEAARHAYGKVIELWEPGGSAEPTVRRMRERIAALE